MEGSIKSVLDKKVIDNIEFKMVDGFEELIPLATTLDMAVGYFFISGYELIKDVFNKLALSGQIRIIMGKKTDINTAKEINEGVSSPKDAIIKEIEQIQKDSKLAYSVYNLKDLISAGKVQVKVYDGPADYFHAKVYLLGRQNSKVDGYAIVGSSNFSKGGLTNNTELNVITLDAYPNIKSWFSSLWESTEVKDFSMELIDIIENRVSKPKNYKSPINLKKPIKEGIPIIPQDLAIRDYQENAINKWFTGDEKGQKHRGTLKMATGSGKTITALALLERAFRELELKCAIIIVPYRHLVTQWENECKKFNLKPICCFESRNKWNALLQAQLYGLSSRKINFLTIITTNKTFASTNFQEHILFFPEETLIIGDEAHNLGASNLINSLPDSIKLRLALSATPERWFDDSGTSQLFNYFGEKLIELTLKEALQIGALVPYKYVPIFVHLTDKEGEEYVELSKSIGKLSGYDVDESENSPVKILLNKRARLIATAKNKLYALRDLMKDKLDSSHTLIYVGDGSIEDDVTEETRSQIDEVCRILGYELGYRIDKYVAETPLDERDNLRKEFDSGELQGLVAIRCLDEGVDVPSIKTAIILASSSNPRQFIQRRGRVLRRHPTKKEATIYDMIVLPPDEVIHYESEKSILKREFNRYIEFAELANNAGEVTALLMAAKEKYDL